jgi:hypothetical protein
MAVFSALFRSSVFAISIFDTDYLLVKAEDLERAVDVLRRRSHTIQGGPGEHLQMAGPVPGA